MMKWRILTNADLPVGKQNIVLLGEDPMQCVCV